MPDNDLDHALASIGTSLAELRSAATEIVVFGSRAADVARVNSDWDLLCVGTGASRATPRIDLVWVDAEELRSVRWTGSELAGHVAAWGRWIWGTRNWHTDIAPAPHAIASKGRRIVARAHALAITWEDLSEDHRHKHLTLLRRDLGRYSLLQRGQPIPPTTCLDAMLRSGDVSQSELTAVTKRLEIFALFTVFSRSLLLDVPLEYATTPSRDTPHGQNLDFAQK